MQKKLTKTQQISLEALYEKRCLKPTKAILREKSHPTNNLYSYLPHGKRLHHFSGKDRFIKRFFPDRVRRLNSYMQIDKYTKPW